MALTEGDWEGAISVGLVETDGFAEALGAVLMVGLAHGTSERLSDMVVTVT